jgi:hypothetical protein
MSVHANLTGANLHEPKGIAGQTAGKVYVSDGANSGAWTATSTFPGSFGTQLLHLRDAQSTNTAGQTYSTGTWNTVRLNLELTDELGSSLVANQFTLPEGVYFVQGWSRTYSTNTLGMATLRLRSISSSSDLLVGVPTYVGSGTGGVSLAEENVNTITGRFSLGATHTVELQKYIKTALSTGGNALNLSGYAEIYTDLLIWKVG